MSRAVSEGPPTGVEGWRVRSGSLGAREGRPSDTGLFATILASLSAYYLLWYLHFWPGVFDFDSGFYVHQILTHQLVDLKPFLYARFLQLFSVGGRYVPAAVAVQILLAAIAFARMLVLVRRAGVPRVALAAYGVLLANPFIGMMLSFVQNDVLFSVAVVMVCCEAAFVARTQRATRASLLVLATFTPMACLFRENGKAFVPLLWAFMALTFPAVVRRKALLVSAACVVLAGTSVIGVDRVQRSNPMYYMVIHEVIGLARPEFQKPLGSRLSRKARAAIGTERLAQAVEWYSPDHWDSIGFVPGGPTLGDIERERKERIIEAFFARDLWANLPAVLGHRLQLFLTAASAGRPFDTYVFPEMLPLALRTGPAETRRADAARGLAGRVYELTFRHRAVLWSPLPGAALAIVLWISGTRRRDPVAFGIGTLLCTQLVLIAGFAPAAEFRYLFLFYLTPLAYGVARPAHAGLPCSEQAEGTTKRTL